MENEKSMTIQTSGAAPVVFNFFDGNQFATMQRVCRMFANSELVPDMYKISENNPEAKAIANCMIALSISLRIGADPLMIMQNMVPIYGKPSWSSKFLIATVNTCGRFNPLRYKETIDGMVGKIEYTDYNKTWVEGTNGRRGYYKKEAVTKVFDGSNIPNRTCVAYTSERGSEEILESTPIDIRMAIQEGWYTKDGSKWKTMPVKMLRYRAASFWTNEYAPEISMGMSTVEEVIDTNIDDQPQVDDKAIAQLAERIKDAGNKDVVDVDAVPVAEGDQAPENGGQKAEDPKPADNPVPDQKPVQKAAEDPAQPKFPNW